MAHPGFQCSEGMLHRSGSHRHCIWRVVYIIFHSVQYPLMLPGLTRRSLPLLHFGFNLQPRHTTGEA